MYVEVSPAESLQSQVLAAHVPWGSGDNRQHAEAAGVQMGQLACSLLGQSSRPANARSILQLMQSNLVMSLWLS